MTTECYAMVRGSAIRVTGLGSRGEIPSPISFAVSKSVAVVRINEATDSGSNELLRTDETDEPRLRFVRSEQTIRYLADINFLRSDPGILSLVSGVPLVTNAVGDVVGFDSNTRLPAASFALELWSGIAGARCADGTRQYGFTVFPFLKGGVLSGFTFSNGLVSFNLNGAQARRSSRWGVGPYDLDGSGGRLLEPVSRNLAWRSFLSPYQPPAQRDGISTFIDAIDGGTATMTTADILDGEFVVTSMGIVEGGRAV